MHSTAFCLLFATFLAVCYGAPNYFKVLRARAQHPLRKSPAEEYLVAKRSRVAVDKDACVKAHNEKRAKHGAQSLRWSDKLARDAQQWADHLANTMKVGHMEHAKDPGEGENLYWSMGSNVASCEDAVEAWYSEEKDYDFNHPPKTFKEFGGPGRPAIGHFTQEVWKETTSVGVAIATREAERGMKETYIVARYLPQGNMLGYFGKNVGRKNHK